MTSKNEVQESHGTVKVPEKRQWHEQAAVAAVNLAQRFQSDILFCADSICIDAKSSLMALMMLGALKGQLLELTARGADSVQALRELSGLFVAKP
jgi:phosphotransferase system HPr (HPr) family protein